MEIRSILWNSLKGYELPIVRIKRLIEVRFWKFLYESGVKIKGKPINLKGIFEKFRLTENMMVKQVLENITNDLLVNE